MYDRRLSGLLTVYHVFSMWLMFCLKKCDCSTWVCYCITKQRQSSGRRDKGYAPSLRTTGFISVYPNPVLCVSAEIPEMNKEVAANRHQSKSHTSELVKKLRIKRVVWFWFWFWFFSGSLLQHGKQLKYSAERKNHRNSSASVRTQWGEQKSVSKLFIFYQSKSA